MATTEAIRENNRPVIPPEVVSEILARRPLPLITDTCRECGEAIHYSGARQGWAHVNAAACYRQKCHACGHAWDIYPRALRCPTCGSDQVSVDHRAMPDRDLTEARDQLKYARREYLRAEEG
jgi:hypothetical protein